MDIAALVAQADRAAAAGDLEGARTLLCEAAEANSANETLWLRIASLDRARGKPQVALQSVHRALAAAPRDFMALLMRASLLDRLGSPEAPEAWAHALAQKPEGDLPPQLAGVIAEGERKQEAWVVARDSKMQAAMADALGSASEDERRRLDRFRSNALRRTRHYHSEPTHFHFPGLVEHEFHPRSMFPWLARLEAATNVIRRELEAVMTAERAELVPYVQYQEHRPLDQWRQLNYNRDWTAIHLLQNGERVEANARHCPNTIALLGDIPQPSIRGAGPNAMFSLLAPHTAIPPHVGVNNARLVCHLPLIVPPGCWFRVGAETREWAVGEAFVFDDTIEHEALNPSDQLRVVFIIDVWHPQLSEVERRGVAAAVEAEDLAPGSV